MMSILGNLGVAMIGITMSMIILFVIFSTPIWFKIIFFAGLIGWMYHGMQGIWYAMLGILVTAIGIGASLFWSSKEDDRHHSEEGTKLWE